MSVYALVSAKGSPGVTTAAAALAAVSASVGRSMLVELDPSGGSVQVLTGRSVVPGVVDAAAQLRRQISAAAIEAHTTLLPDGVPALLAPSSGPATESVISSVGDRWLAALRECDADVVVDAGRWEPSQMTARRIFGADLVVVVCRPTVASVEHTRQMLGRLRERAQRPVAAIVVGDRPYAPEEVAAHLDAPLAGVVAWDPRGVANLWNGGVSRGWLRAKLARSASMSLAGLAYVAYGETQLALPAPAGPAAPWSGPQSVPQTALPQARRPDPPAAPVRPDPPAVADALPAPPPPPPDLRAVTP